MFKAEQDKQSDERTDIMDGRTDGVKSLIRLRGERATWLYFMRINNSLD